MSWKVDNYGPDHAEIHSYQIYAYEETSAPPDTANWRHVGDVKALLLPMAVTLTQFQEGNDDERMQLLSKLKHFFFPGQKYFFAVRAMDDHKRLGQFSLPKTWADK